MTAADGAEITTEIIEAEDGGHEIIITAEDGVARVRRAYIDPWTFAHQRATV